MKLRKEFVTNSSSCSYVFFGFAVDNNKLYKALNIQNSKYPWEEMKDIFKDFDVFEGYDFGLDGKWAIGIHIGDIRDDDPIEQDMTFEELTQMKEKIEKKMNEIGLNEEIKLIFGTRSC